MSDEPGHDEPPQPEVDALGLDRLPTEGLRRPLGDSSKALVRAALFGEPVSHRLGRFDVRGKLGQGGMATVLRAYDDTLDREVALKVLHRHRRAQLGHRLMREAQALAKLSHPNVVQVYEVGEIGDQTFIAMELVRGQTLAQWQQHDHPWRECVRVYVQAARGLAAAHAQGLVHRDFKPANCILDEEGRVRVLDFGLVRQVLAEDGSSIADEAPAEELDEPEPSVRRAVTRTGTILGTLAYMAPEQRRRQPTDAASDQFSFCVSLYEALYGQRPFEDDETLDASADSRRWVVRPAVAGRSVPERLRRVLLRGLCESAGDRWPSMTGLADALARLAEPRRGRWLALGAVLGLGAAGVGLARYAEVGFRCEGAEAMLDGIWGDDRARDVEAALLGTEASHAADTWSKIQPRLDTYAEDWTRAHTSVCEATRVTETQTEEVMDLRMACLDRRRIALAEAVTVLADADRETVDRAVPMVAALPGLARCDDINALRAAVPPPDDPQVREAVEELRRTLARVEALRQAGRLEQSRRESEAAVEAAMSLDYPPVHAEAWLQQGLAHQHLMQHEAAERLLRRAYVEGTKLEHAAVESAAASALAYVVGSHEQSEGLVWSTTALALAQRAHAEPEEEARALHARAAALHDGSDWDGAREDWEKALAIWERLHGSQHPDVISTMGSLAMLHGDQGRLSEAIELIEQSLSLARQTLGPMHPELGSMLHNLGAYRFRQGEYAASAESMQQCLEVFEATMGEDSPGLVASLGVLGNAQRKLGQDEAAIASFRRAIAIGEASDEVGAGELAQALNGLGATEYKRGNVTEGIETMGRALEVLESAPGDQSRDLPLHLHNLGIVLLDQDRFEEAKVRFERAIELAEKTVGAEHPLVSAPLYGLAETTLALGDRSAALVHAERALAVREGSEVPSDWIAEARFMVARALGGTEPERARARRLAQQAHDAYAELAPRFSKNVDAISAWLQDHPGP